MCGNHGNDQFYHHHHRHYYYYYYYYYYYFYMMISSRGIDGHVIFSASCSQQVLSPQIYHSVVVVVVVKEMGDGGSGRW